MEILHTSQKGGCILSAIMRWALKMSASRCTRIRVSTMELMATPYCATTTGFKARRSAVLVALVIALRPRSDSLRRRAGSWMVPSKSSNLRQVGSFAAGEHPGGTTSINVYLFTSVEERKVDSAVALNAHVQINVTGRTVVGLRR